MFKYLTFLKLAALIISVAFLVQCSGTIDKTEIKSVGMGGGDLQSLPDEANIEVIEPNYELEEKNVEALQSLPMPEVKFAFESKSISNDELPEDVKYFLREHWRESVKYFYDQAFNKPKSSQEYSERMKNWSNYCTKTDRNLRKSLIAAPNGYRNVSQKESMSLWGGLNRAAIAVVGKLK